MTEDPAEPSAAGPRCARHTEQPRAFTCARCGDYGCAGCRSVRDEALCERCADAVAVASSASLLAIGAAVLGFLGVGCAPIGWLGVVLGAVDLVRAAASGRRGGALLSVIGIGCGALGTALWLAAFLLPAYP